MIKYPKIQTLFKRDKETHKVTTELNVTDFNNVKNIIITEKIDGTNAQIELWHNRQLGVGTTVYSRNNSLGCLSIDTNTGKIVTKDEPDIMYIKETIMKRINLQNLRAWYYPTFCLDKKGGEREVATDIRIYGEVYGAGINKGGIYSPEKQFRVFDIQIGEHFISFYKVKEICNEVGLKIVPVIYEGGIKGSTDYNVLFDRFCRLPKTRILEKGVGGILEGYVIKSEPLLLNEYGQRIIAKIKRKDFPSE